MFDLFVVAVAPAMITRCLLPKAILSLSREIAIYYDRQVPPQSWRSSESLVLAACTGKASVTEARGPEEELGIPEVDYLRVHFGMEELTSNRHRRHSIDQV